MESGSHVKKKSIDFLTVRMGLAKAVSAALQLTRGLAKILNFGLGPPKRSAL